MNTTAETYPTIEAAVADLQTLCGTVILGQERRELRELITANGLSRRYVADLAVELNAEADKQSPHSNRKMMSIYERIVSVDGVVSLDGILYQVPKHLEGQSIWINPDLGEYYLTAPQRQPASVALQTLRLGNVAS